MAGRTRAVPWGGVASTVRTGSPSRRRRALAWAVALAFVALVVLAVAGRPTLGCAGAAPLTIRAAPGPGNPTAGAAAVSGGSEGTAGGSGPLPPASVPGDPAQDGWAQDGWAQDGWAQALRARWDGPTMHLDWRGRAYATAEASFVGDRVLTPGDDVHRTLAVGNGGPADAVMTVRILFDDQSLTRADEVLAARAELYWDVAEVHGALSMDRLRDAPGGSTVVAAVRVPRAATVPVTVGVRMRADETAGRDTGDDPADGMAFRVLVRLGADTSSVPAPGVLPRTGAAVADLVVVALVLVGLGRVLVAASRRRSG
ncbi:hypothetical protein ET495_16925 [Xylanimonas allomyrinae]|uniref:Uncharacterized protein n=1 Tax=Xylanimonas allomyrinae TaxID=2509459 RepID=A0A4P6EQ54_9MICO|nr:hypothetical protein [Xylanimonas allomyrinae]QAY64605.1 hypothetical protein ET495_16925 [Xylanimonas allomyrinae]